MQLQHSDAKSAQSTIQTMIDNDESVQDVYAVLQRLCGTRVLVDKSPSYGASLDTLRRAEAMFEGNRYIHLVRHPHAVIESFVRNRMDKVIGIATDDPFVLAEQAWLTTNGNIRRFLSEVDEGRRHLVRYEDLVTDPSGISRKLCEFLEVEFEPAMLEPYEGGRMTDGVHSQSLPIGDPGFLSHTCIDSTLADVWRTIQLPRPISEPARQLASTFGYAMAPPQRRPDRELRDARDVA
jgi:hypothetical protein